MPDLVSLETAVEELLSKYHGLSVAELTQEVSGPVTLEGKSPHALVIRRLLEERGVAADLANRGITYRVVRVDEDGDPLEKTNLRNFDHEALPREDWETSEFRAETRQILFVVFDAEKGQPVEEAVLRGGVFWRPDTEADAVMRHEWELARETIKYKLPPPKEADTKAVHVGTKGRDSFDLEKGAGGETYRKECLALNKRFVAEIIRRVG